MSVRVHCVLTVGGVRPYRFSEEIALRERWPPLESACVFIVLPENLLQEHDIGLKDPQGFADPRERKRTIPKTEPFVNIVRENFEDPSIDHACRYSTYLNQRRTRPSNLSRNGRWRQFSRVTSTERPRSVTNWSPITVRDLSSVTTISASRSCRRLR